MWQTEFMGFINRPSCNDRVQVRKRQAVCFRLACVTFVCCVLVFTLPLLWDPNTLNGDNGDQRFIVLLTMITPDLPVWFSDRNPSKNMQLKNFPQVKQKRIQWKIDFDSGSLIVKHLG